MSKMVHHISVKEDAKHVLMLMRILSHEDNGDDDSDDGEEDQAPGSHFFTQSVETLGMEDDAGIYLRLYVNISITSLQVLLVAILLIRGGAGV